MRALAPPPFEAGFICVGSRPPSRRSGVALAARGGSWFRRRKDERANLPWGLDGQAEVRHRFDETITSRWRRLSDPVGGARPSLRTAASNSRSATSATGIEYKVRFPRLCRLV